MTLEFGHIAWLWLLLIVPALLALRIAAARRAEGLLREMVPSRLKSQLLRSIHPLRRGLKFALALASLALVAFALAAPRYGERELERTRRGLDLLVVMDASRSMLADDLRPNRLARAKLAVQDLVRSLEGDRVGLVAFAGTAFLQCPLTIDYGAFLTTLEEVDSEIIPRGGTNIARALETALEAFKKSEGDNRALVLITDGEELDDDAAAMAAKLADAGVRVFALGVGSPEGALIPVPDEGGGTAFVRDPSGEIVRTRLDESRLRAIAAKTGGFYLRFDGMPSILKVVEEGLGKMTREDIDTRQSSVPIERYQWPLGAAIVALLASLLIPERPLRRRAPGKPREAPVRKQPASAEAMAAVILLCLGASLQSGRAGDPSALEAFENQDYASALEKYRGRLERLPGSAHADKLHYGAGTAAYKAGRYEEAAGELGNALLSRDGALQAKAHYNLGNALYRLGEKAERDAKGKLSRWNSSLQHYEEARALDPGNDRAAVNHAFVKRKIEELKKQQQQEEEKKRQEEEQKKEEQKKEEQKKKEKREQESKDSQKGKDGDQENQDSKKGEGKDRKPEDSQGGGEDQKKSEQQEGKAGENSEEAKAREPKDGDGKREEKEGGRKQEEGSEEGKDSEKTSQGNQDTRNDGQKRPGDASLDDSEKKHEGEMKAAGDPQPAESEPGEKGREVPAGEAGEPRPETPAEAAAALLESLEGEEARVPLHLRRGGGTAPVLKDW